MWATCYVKQKKKDSKKSEPRAMYKTNRITQSIQWFM